MNIDYFFSLKVESFREKETTCITIVADEATVMLGKYEKLPSRLNMA